MFNMNLYAIFLKYMYAYFFQRGNLRQKRQKSYRNSHLWQSWLPTPNIKQINRTRQNQKLVRQQIWEVVRGVKWLLLISAHCHVYLALCLCATVTPAESFDWGQYICSNNTAGAPVSCFKHVSEARLTRFPRDLPDDALSYLTPRLLQAPMGKCWGDIEEGVRIEVVNTDTNLPTKVYWIAEIIKLAGKRWNVLFWICSFNFCSLALSLFQYHCI